MSRNRIVDFYVRIALNTNVAFSFGTVRKSLNFDVSFAFSHTEIHGLYWFDWLWRFCVLLIAKIAFRISLKMTMHKQFCWFV